VLIFTGGTISMVDDGSGPSPALGAAVLGSGVDRSVTATVAIDWGLVPGAHLTMQDLLSIAQLMQAAINDGATGIVVVQGTDTIEETSWAWELMRAWEVPVVVTGAMRNASETGFDGPQNLRDAVTCVRALAGRTSLPVLVSFAGWVHAARDVTKADALRLDSFVSLGEGPVGRIDEGSLMVLRDIPPATVLPSSVAASVEVVSLGIDTGLPTLEAAVSSKTPGIVLEAPGQGHTSPAVFRLGAAYLAAGGTLVVTSRCAAGPAIGAYGFVGGGRDWVQAGAIFAERLGTWKARTLTSLAIGAGLSSDRIHSAVAVPTHGTI